VVKLILVSDFYMNTVGEQIGELKSRVKQSEIPDELVGKIVTRLTQLESVIESSTFLPEFDRLNRYVEWVIQIPWNKESEDKLDLNYAKEVLDKNHHGLVEIKNRILEYISVMKLKRDRGESEDVMRAPILSFVGLVGTGKTTIASSIAEALGRNFARIPFGGMGDPLDLRGRSRMHGEAEPGKVIKSLVNVQNKNPVILLDEIDRVTDQGRSSIMGVLVELLDPEQNSRFVDHYIDFPVDLSEVLFIATANNTNHISTAVLDRLEPIQMPSYIDDEKITIGKKYMLPKVLAASGIPENMFAIADDTWAKIVRPLGFDAGMRTLERTINAVVRKAARQILEGKTQKIVITNDNVREFLPR
jgi:ATP-dependent Lon protease